MVETGSNKGIWDKIKMLYTGDVETIKPKKVNKDTSKRYIEVNNRTLIAKKHNEILLGIVTIIINAVIQADITLKKNGEVVTDSDFSYKLRYTISRNGTFKSFIREVLTQYYLQSESYILIKSKGRGMNNIIGLQTIEPRLVTKSIDLTDDSPLYEIEGLSGVVQSYQMIHLKSLTLDGLTAVDIKKGLDNTETLSSKSDESYYNKMSKNNYPFLLNFKQPLGFDDDDPVTQKIAEYYTGVIDNYLDGSAPLILDETAVTADPIDENPYFFDIEKVETVVKSRLANAFNVPYGMIDSTAGYSGREDIYRVFINQTITPLLTMISDEFNRKLLTPDEIKQGYAIEFDLFTLYKTDLKTLAESFKNLVRGSVITPNEARHILGYGKLDEGDELLISEDLISVVDRKRQINAQIGDINAPVVEDG